MRNHLGRQVLICRPFLFGSLTRIYTALIVVPLFYVCISIGESASLSDPETLVF
jgi:hypothetical protein